MTASTAFCSSAWPPSLSSLPLHCACEADFAVCAPGSAQASVLPHLENASNKGLERFSILMHLTSLQFLGVNMRDTAKMVQQRLAVQSQLGRALLSLAHLQQLELGDVSSGPVTDALEQADSSHTVGVSCRRALNGAIRRHT